MSNQRSTSIVADRVASLNPPRMVPTARLAARLARRHASGWSSTPDGGQARPLNGNPRTLPTAHLPPAAYSLQPRGGGRRAGLTLIELLVVIMLLLIVTAVAIPVLAPNSEQRRIREAARLVNTFISGARNRAIELGRPVGIQFERLVSNPNAAMVLSYVEVPPLYAGDMLDSAAQITLAGFAPGVSPIITIKVSTPKAAFNNRLIRVGDLIKFNYQGRYFVITGPDSQPNVITTATGPDGYLDDPPATDTLCSFFCTCRLAFGQDPGDVFGWAQESPANSGNWSGSSTTALPYQITRQPMKTSDAPLQLSEGAVVDLTWSGMGFGLITPSTSPVQVLISPDGQVAATYGFDGTMMAQPATAPIHFLIGSPEKAIGGGDPTAKDNVVFNYQDGNNLWVSIGPQTGLVSTAEVARPGVALGATSNWSGDGYNSRGIAATLQSMGGR